MPSSSPFNPSRCDCGLRKAAVLVLMDPDMHLHGCTAFKQSSSPSPSPSPYAFTSHRHHSPSSSSSSSRSSSSKRKSADRRHTTTAAAGMCWVWPHSTPRAPTKLHRLVDLLTGRGPDPYVRSRGYKPSAPLGHHAGGPHVYPWVDRQGKVFNPLSCRYEWPPRKPAAAASPLATSPSHYEQAAFRTTTTTYSGPVGSSSWEEHDAKDAATSPSPSVEPTNPPLPPPKQSKWPSRDGVGNKDNSNKDDSNKDNSNKENSKCSIPSCCTTAADKAAPEKKSKPSSSSSAQVHGSSRCSQGPPPQCCQGSAQCRQGLAQDLPRFGHTNSNAAAARGHTAKPKSDASKRASIFTPQPQCGKGSSSSRDCATWCSDCYDGYSSVTVADGHSGCCSSDSCANCDRASFCRW